MYLLLKKFDCDISYIIFAYIIFECFPKEFFNPENRYKNRFIHNRFLLLMIEKYCPKISKNLTALFKLVILKFSFLTCFKEKL